MAENWLERLLGNASPLPSREVGLPRQPLQYYDNTPLGLPSPNEALPPPDTGGKFSERLGLSPSQEKPQLAIEDFSETPKQRRMGNYGNKESGPTIRQGSGQKLLTDLKKGTVTWEEKLLKDTPKGKAKELLGKVFGKVGKKAGIAGLVLTGAAAAGAFDEPDENAPNFLYQIQNASKAVKDLVGEGYDNLFSSHADIARKDEIEKEQAALAQEEQMKKMLALQQQAFGGTGGEEPKGPPIQQLPGIGMGQQQLPPEYGSQFEQLKQMFAPQQSQVPVIRPELSDDAILAQTLSGAEGVIPALFGSYYKLKARKELSDLALDEKYNKELREREKEQYDMKVNEAKGFSDILKLEMESDLNRTEAMKPKVHLTPSGALVESTDADGKLTLTPFTGSIFQAARVKGAVDKNANKFDILGRTTKINPNEPYAKEQMVLARLYETGQLDAVMEPVINSDFWKELPIQVQQQYMGEQPETIAKIVHQQRLATLAAALNRKPDLAEKAYRAAGLIE